MLVPMMDSRAAESCPVPARCAVLKIGGVDSAEVWTAAAASGARQRRLASW